MNTLFTGQRGVEIASRELVELANRNGIECQNGISARILSEKIQTTLTRKEEHQYQIQGEPATEENLRLLDALGMVRAVEPPPANYEGTLLLGGTLGAMRRRLAFVLEQWRAQNHLDTGTIYFLVSQRSVENENMDALCTPDGIPFKSHWTLSEPAPKTETDVARIIWEQSIIPLGINATFVDTPFQPTKTAETKRSPNTTDTVIEFLKLNPEQGMWLVASSQPFVQRQALNVIEVLGNCSAGYTVVEMGPSASPDLPLQTYLDEVARLLWQSLK